MSTQNIRNTKGITCTVCEFTYNEIDERVIELSYKLLKSLGDFSLPIHFEVSSKIYEVLSEAINKFGGDKGKMLNGFKFQRNIKLKEAEMKIELD